ncbi:arginyl tRNA-synthetase [Tupanvirus deep ocean]|uniref:Arginyl tRNA-synthetase n=2 Tax=Tupanvirus TaxID=2094720 RepID=A0AC62A9X0_9VIRU|nr:arginyl tRNA-synthetase [Tupanvirus deep ocean]QKU34581.1 arginyl tRNA-synthetase [Tupanvirus deep ocean]
MENITEQINSLIKKSIASCFQLLELEFSKFKVHRGNKTDFQFTQTNAIAKILGLSPDEIAQKIYQKLNESEFLESVEIVKTDKQIFITFNVNKKYLQSVINDINKNVISKQELPPPKIPNLPNTVLIDFSSPNIAKEMHVGHLRSTIIGESLCRTFEYCGSNVKRVNHIGDWGTQFGMLIAYIKKNKITDYDLPMLMTMYKESRKLFDTDTDFNRVAHHETVKLQQGDVTNIALWKNICDISMASFNKIYEQLQTHAEIKGESFYQPYMMKLVEELQPKLIISDGMKILFGSGIKVPMIIVKSDGGFTYDTSDLAAVKYRVQEEKADLIVYVVDSGQQQHFEVLFKVVSELGWVKQNQLQHVGFGLVLGSDGKKLKTRSGETLRLQDLLNHAYEHSWKVTNDLAKEKHPEWNKTMIEIVSKKIAINCIKYADLSNPRLSNYKFSVEKMINLKGNTAVYLMYALARCKAILRKVPNIETILPGEIIIDNEESHNLAFKVCKYGEIINDTVEQLQPHHLCNYLYDLVGLLTKYYDKNRCIDFDNNGDIVHIHEHRIRMVNLVMILISKLFDLIGLEHIDQI